MLLQSSAKLTKRSGAQAIRSALSLAKRKHGWHSMAQLDALAWRMLDDNPKHRIELLAAAAIADGCLAALQHGPSPVFSSTTLSPCSTSTDSASAQAAPLAPQVVAVAQPGAQPASSVANGPLLTWRPKKAGRKLRYAD